MIKEIFEIEPIQKNTLIVFLGLFSLIFLQIFLFNPELFDKGVLISLLFTLGMTVSWTILSLPSMIMFFLMIEFKNGEKRNKGLLILENVILTCGLFIIGWILMLTYIAYELNFDFKDLIRLGIAVSFTRFILWSIIYLIRNFRRKKLSKE